MAKPKLALIPAAQGSKLFSVLPSSGVGDFNFSRSGKATRINSQGLIEEVSNGQSRLNYPMIDGKVVGCPSHLLENSATNLVTYSEDFTEGNWGKTNITIISNDIISPDGTLNASRLTDDATDGLHVLGEGNTFVSGNTYTASVFAKKGTASRIFAGAGNPATWGADCYFDLDNGTVSLESIGTASIEDYGNGWYRCIVVGTANADASTNFLFGLSDNTNDKTYIGSGDYAYVWGAQFEQGSYPTSYIPTNGSAVTRSAEVANSSGDADTFNDSEGVLMAEISALANDGTSRRIALSNGNNTNRIEILYTSSNDLITYLVVSGNTAQANGSSANIATQFNKVAVKYKANDFAFWINGFELLTDDSGITPTGLNTLRFEQGDGGNDFYGKTKQLQYHNSALTDSELEQLTSWTSFSDMANGQLYTIE